MVQKDTEIIYPSHTIADNNLPKCYLQEIIVHEVWGQTRELLRYYQYNERTGTYSHRCFFEYEELLVKYLINSNPEKMQYLLDNGKFYVYVVRTVRKFVNAVDEQTAVINARDKELQQAKTDGNEEKYWRIFHNNKLCAEEMCRDIMYGN